MFSPDAFIESFGSWAKYSDCRDMVSEAHDIGYGGGVVEERKRIVEALRAKHEAAKHIHNHYACLAREIEEGEL